jgi:AcrR family transcriptional regulator
MSPAQDARPPEALYDKLSPGPGRLASDVAAHQRARIHSAMVELVGERGYAAVKMRDVVRLAGVSTRSFYDNFGSKEDCFLRTHELIVRGAARRIDAAQAEELDWRERTRLVFDAFAREVTNAPYAARLVLVDAYEAGIDALEQAWRAESTFEALIGVSIARDPDGVVVPPLVAEGIVAGVARLTRFRLLAGKEEDFAGLGDELTEWVLALLDRSAAELAALDTQSASIGGVVSEVRVQPEGDRTNILAAAAELAEADGYPYLTIPRIRVHAGVSRSAFNAQFAGVDDCFLSTLELRADEAMAEAVSAQALGQTWAGGIYRAIVTLCARFGSDPLLVNLCLDDDFTSGSSGSAWRRRLVGAIVDSIDAGVPSEHRPSRLANEASKNAIWELFHHDIVRSPTPEGPQIAATLSYIALAPAIGAAEAMAAIRGELVA